MTYTLDSVLPDFNMTPPGVNDPDDREAIYEARGIKFNSVWDGCIAEYEIRYDGDCEAPDIWDFWADWTDNYAVTRAQIHYGEHPEHEDDDDTWVSDYAEYLAAYNDYYDPAAFAQYRQWRWESKYGPRTPNYAELQAA